MIAAKIVETFFDCKYNPYVNYNLTYPTILKKALADSLSKNNILIIEFAELVKNGTLSIERMKLIKQELQNHFKRISPSLSTIIGKLRDDSLLKMIDEFKEITKNGSEKKWISLVSPILFDRIKCLDDFCYIFSEHGYIYVDQLSGFQDVFDQLNTFLNNKGINKCEIQISMCDSKNEPLIQAADLLSGFIVRSFMEINKVKSCNKINNLWRKLICKNEIYSNGVIFSNDVWKYYADEDFPNLIFDLAKLPRMKIECPELVIKENIQYAIKDFS